MNSKYLLIKQLIDKVAVYEEHIAENDTMSLEGFMEFINKPGESNSVYRKLGGPLEQPVQTQGERKETTIAIFVTFIYRYAKLYAKKVLQDSKINTLDDFSYIIVLLTHESMSKTELIQKNVHEKTTGMEIIKRLIRNGLVHQFDDVNDKRTQRIAITPEGRMAVFSVLHKLEDVSTIMTGNLTELEKNGLNTILKKLDHFHFDIFMHDKNKTLKEIICDRIKE